MSFDLILGSALVFFGVYTALMRFVAPKQFSKLDAMKKKWGEQRGLALHVFAYSILPIIAGGLMVLNELT